MGLIQIYIFKNLFINNVLMTEALEQDLIYQILHYLVSQTRFKPKVSD